MLLGYYSALFSSDFLMLQQDIFLLMLFLWETDVLTHCLHHQDVTEVELAEEQAKQENQILK